jgi:hypothetical protein
MFFEIVFNFVFLMCERGGIGRRPRLINLSAHKETYGVEPVKFGEGCKMLIPSQASDRNISRRCRD